MQFEQVSKVKFNEQYRLFDATQTVFVFAEGIPFYPHIVEKEEEMRMDLISDRLYETTDHTAFLCRLNNIINPLNIKEGTLLIWCEERHIESFTPPDIQFTEEVKQTLVNLNKKRRVDSKRERFLRSEEQNISLPPIFNDEDTENVTISDDGVITIGPGEVG